MYDWLTLLAIAGTFLLAGSVKGVIGLGLPTVSLGLLTAALDLTTAMALLIVPSFVTNLWQGAVGGHARAIIVRTWPFLLTAAAFVWVGAQGLTAVSTHLLSALLGVLLILYATLNLAGVRIQVTAMHERWVGPVFGTINGILTGLTGSFVVPGVMFLQAIGLSRDMLVQAMGILFAVSTVALAGALHSHDLLTLTQSGISLAAVVPAIVGMLIGQWIRKRLSEATFRKVFFVAILLLGLYIVAQALG
ncbi:MAG: sulfite exporter TauE/SafE family protein [Chromatiales bacterium]|nr:sulfite exporter TauE/SafE family protein [Chromatiales bacterium]